MSSEHNHIEVYAKHGIKFLYPDDWELEESENEDGVTITLDSPLTVSLTICILPSCPGPIDVIEQIVDVFKSEYEELDLYEINETAYGEFAVISRELEFVCHELINIVRISSLMTHEFSLLLMSQGYDQDVDKYGVVLENIFQSLEIIDADEDFTL